MTIFCSVIRRMLLCGFLISLLGFVAQRSSYAAPAGFTDAVVASVNGKPITWSDVTSRIGASFTGTIENSGNDPRVRDALDNLILEQLVQEDAEAKRLSASKEEVESYIQEIAQRNGMSVSQFQAALAAEGKDFADYTQQVRIEVLKGKLASAYLRGGVTVSEEEIDQVLKEQPALLQRGSRVELGEVFVAQQESGSPTAREKIEQAKREIEEGIDFAEVVSKFSEGAGRESGGSLGMINERELSREIFDAVLLLKPGQVSEIVETARGLHIFKVLQRSVDTAEVELLRGEVRKQLQSMKVDEKLNSFFTTELYKNYSVDKKI